MHKSANFCDILAMLKPKHVGSAVLAPLPTDALATYRDCIEFDPYHVPAVEKLVEFYERKGQLQPALETLKAAVALQPRDSRLHHLLSRMHLKLGDTKQALHHAREASLLAPTDSERREGYATLLVQHAPDAVQTIFQRGRDRALMAALCQKLAKTRQPAACQP